jgi:hypothetical protein
MAKLGVWVVEDDSAALRAGQVGRGRSRWPVQVLDGLKAGERVVVYSQRALDRRQPLQGGGQPAGSAKVISLAGRDILHAWGKFVFTGVGLGLLIGVTLTMAGVYRGMVDDAKACSTTAAPTCGWCSRTPWGRMPNPPACTTTPIAASSA